MRSKLLMGSLLTILLVAFTLQATAQYSQISTSSNEAVSAAYPDAKWTAMSGVAGRPVVMSSLPQATAADLAQPNRIRRPLNGLTDAQTRALKMQVFYGSLGLHATPVPAQYTGSPSGSFTHSPGKNFAGLSQSQSTCGTCTPPDEGIAVAFSLGVQVVNTAINVFSKKDGTSQGGYPKSALTFFARPAGTFVTDPRVFFDINQDRFVLEYLEEDFATQQSFLLLGVSANADPTGAWTTFRVQLGGPSSTTDCADYPTLSNDHTQYPNEGIGGVYLSYNWFSNAGGFCNGGYVGNSVLLIPKSSLYAGVFGAIRGINFSEPGTGIVLDTLQPVNVPHPTDHPRTTFWVASENILFHGGQCSGWHVGNSCNGVTLYSFSNPFGWVSGGPVPTVSALKLGTFINYGLPNAAPEPSPAGCTAAFGGCIETIDTRITGTPVYSAGHIFLSFETATFGPTPPNVSNSSWYWADYHPILNDNGGGCVGAFFNACPTLTGADIVQQQWFNNGFWPRNGAAFFSQVQPDQENNLAAIFSYSDDTTLPEVAHTTKRTSSPNGLFHDVGIVVFAGASGYSEGRWGDYAAGATDEAAGGFPSIWLATQDVNPDGSWGTRIINNGFEIFATTP